MYNKTDEKLMNESRFSFDEKIISRHNITIDVRSQLLSRIQKSKALFSPFSLINQ